MEKTGNGWRYQGDQDTINDRVLPWIYGNSYCLASLVHTKGGAMERNA